MHLTDCVLDVDMFVAAPFERDQPEERWVNARDSGAIPGELYDLYRAAGFLSFRSGSRFLTDDQNVLFSYFSMVLNCLIDGLVDANGNLADFVRNQNLTHDAGKKVRGNSGTLRLIPGQGGTYAIFWLPSTAASTRLPTSSRYF
jgi:hypothetical protein